MYVRVSLALLLLGLSAGVSPVRAEQLPALITEAELHAAEVRVVLADAREDEVRAVVVEWYSQLSKGGDGSAFRLFAPLAIHDGSGCGMHADGTPIKYYVSPLTCELAYHALDFSYEIEQLKVDDNFARAEVWERGWFYAAANGVTYENAAHATFILERDDKGGWKIAAFTSRNAAVRPEHANDPMPDMRGAFFRRFPD